MAKGTQINKCSLLWQSISKFVFLQGGEILFLFCKVALMMRRLGLLMDRSWHEQSLEKGYTSSEGLESALSFGCSLQGKQWVYFPITHHSESLSWRAGMISFSCEHLWTREISPAHYLDTPPCNSKTKKHAYGNIYVQWNCGLGSIPILTCVTVIFYST